LFNAGTRPAINVGLSVSRVGGAAQTKAMKKVAGRLRLSLVQFREMVTFAQFGTSDLDPSTRSQLERGQRITEVLKQPQYRPMPLEKQVSVLYAAINGYLDKIPVGKVSQWEKDFTSYLEASYPQVLKNISQTKQMDDNTEKELTKAIEEFSKTQKYE